MMGQEEKAWIAKTANDWFDILNSRLKYHKSNKNKYAMGINEDLQLESLKSMIQNVKFGGYSKPIKCSKFVLLSEITLVPETGILTVGL